jgi:hypothetical protein
MDEPERPAAQRPPQVPIQYRRERIHDHPAQAVPTNPTKRAAAAPRSRGVLERLRSPATACADCGEPTRNRFGICDPCVTRRHGEAKEEHSGELASRQREPAGVASAPAPPSPATAAEPAVWPILKRRARRHLRGALGVVVLLVFAFGGGWLARNGWDTWNAWTYKRASAECEALATYSDQRRGFRVYRRVDWDQWQACMRGKGFEPHQ